MCRRITWGRGDDHDAITSLKRLRADLAVAKLDQVLPLGRVDIASDGAKFERHVRVGKSDRLDCSLDGDGLVLVVSAVRVVSVGRAGIQHRGQSCSTKSLFRSGYHCVYLRTTLDEVPPTPQSYSVTCVRTIGSGSKLFEPLVSGLEHAECGRGSYDPGDGEHQEHRGGTLLCDQIPDKHGPGR